MSFVNGAYSFKIGYQGSQLGDIRSANRGPNAAGATRFNNGVPNQLTMFINDFQNDLWMRDDALFAQGQWTLNHLTLQGGVRFDRAWSWSPEQQEGPTTFLPTPLIYPETPGVDSYKDLTPRMAATWDVFGNGKTAVKGNIGKNALEATITASNYGIANPTSRIVSNVSTKLDRQQRQLLARLQSPESQRAGPALAGRRRVRRVLEHELRDERVQQHHRSGDSQWLGHAAF